MKTDDKLVECLVSAASLVKKMEALPMDDVLRFHIFSARLALNAAVAHAAPLTIVVEPEVH